MVHEPRGFGGLGYPLVGVLHRDLPPEPVREAVSGAVGGDELPPFPR
jgi:hypothetical protein